LEFVWNLGFGIWNFYIMSLPKFLEPFLPSYDISQMDLKNPDDKKLIIEAVLNQGTKLVKNQEISIKFN